MGIEEQENRKIESKNRFILSNLVLYCREMDWIVLYIPNLYHMLFKSNFVETSPYKNNTFELYEYNVLTLKRVSEMNISQFLSQYEDKLKRLVMKKPLENKLKESDLTKVIR